MFSSSRFALNSVSYTSARVVMGAVNLVIVPYIVLRIGFKTYGAWILISSTFSYLGLLDLSLGTAFVRVVANRVADSYQSRVNEAAWSLTLYNLAIAALVSAVLIPLARLLGTAVFHVPSSFIIQWQQLVIASCLLFAFGSIGNIYSVVLLGLQLISESTAASFAAWVVGLVAIFACLHLGFGVWSLVAGGAVGICINVFLARRLVRRHQPGFRWLFQHAAAGFLRNNFGFGLGMQVSRAVDIVNLELDNVLIGIVAGTQAVSYYNIGMTLATLPKDLTSGVVNAYFPEASSRVGRGDDEAASRLYWRTLHLLVLVNFFVAGGVVACAGSFVPVWFQRSIPYAALTGGAIGVAYAIHQCTAPGTSYLWAQGRSGWASVYGVVGAAINVGLTIPLAIHYGFIGVIWGTTIGLSVGSLIFFVYFHKLFLPGLAQALSLLGRVAVACVGGILVGYGVAAAVPGPRSLVWHSLEKFLIAGVLYTLVFAMLAVSFRLVDPRSISQLASQAKQKFASRRLAARPQ